MKNSIITVIQVKVGDLCLFLITNKLVDNIAKKISLATLEMFRAFLRSQILCQVK